MPGGFRCVQEIRACTGSTTLSGGSLSVPTLTIQGGTLTGAGTLSGSVVNGGTVAPGSSGPGQLTITGSYTQNSGGTLSIELGGLTVGTQFDKLAVGGSATLDGTLAVAYINSFVPVTGNTFDVLSYASKTGTFATLPTINPPVSVAQNTTLVRLTVLNPVPTLTTLAPASTGMGSSDFTLTLTGSYFISGSVVKWAGQADLTPLTQSATQLTVTIPASYVATNGSAAVTVFNPTPGGGTSGSQTFTILPTPVFSSAPFANPNPATVNQPVTFTAAATIFGGAPLTYTWTFGDGSPDVTGASRSHTYAASGKYTASVTATDGVNPASSAQIAVTVNAPSGLVGEGLDSDGDGFADSFELAVGSNPNNAASTPTGAAATPETIKAFSLSKASIKLNFAKTGKDTLSFSGTVAVPANYAPKGAKVEFAVGGLSKSLTLTDKGIGTNGGDSIKIALKAKNGAILANPAAKFSVNFKNGAFATLLLNSGLSNADAKGISVTVPFNFIFDNTVYQKSLTMRYTAKKGKSGMAKK